MAHNTGRVMLSILAALLVIFGSASASQANNANIPAVSVETAAMAAPAAAPVALAAPSLLVAPLPVVSVAAGFEHTCALITGMGVRCWGSNRYGQLGSSLLTIHPFPIPVGGLAGTVTQIAAGAYHTCALAGGQVFCWGSNSLGQLGNGTLNNSSSPVQVSGISGATAIAAGYGYTCAIVAGGAVQCWGDNADGQLGNNSTTGSATPVTVSGLSNAVAITGGFDHTCALISGGAAVQCWGRNFYGELGNGSTTDSSVPVAAALALPAGQTIIDIAAGSQHTCARTSASTVWCWGEGSLGQMGTGSTNSKNPTPTVISGLNTAQAISAGGYADTGHTCVVTTSGGVECWGSNVLGQLGDGSTTNRASPTPVSGISNASQVFNGVNHTCALLSSGMLSCWGSDSSGQLGDGVNSVSANAVTVSGLSSGVTLLGTGEQNTCALASGQVLCWGNNRSGQLGDGTFTNRPLPTPVSGLSGTVTAIDSGANRSCAIVDGGVKCWGSAYGSLTSIIAAGSGVTALSVTNVHACAVVGGSAKCWGDNSHGQLGDGSTNNSPSTPVQVSGLTSGVKSVATGQWFSCALLTSGQVQCWGDNTSGQIGTGSAGAGLVTVPQPVVGLTNASVITAGQDHACAATTGGAAWCWGNNQQGQLGDGTGVQQASPVQVNGLTGGVTAITAGGFHTCALANGAALCWGFNSFGQLGNGLTTHSKVPVGVIGLAGGMRDIVAGGINYDEEHTCAINSALALTCWGGNEYGQLGDNLQILHSVPVHVLGLASGPEMGINYTSGKQQSYFRVAVANFTPGANIPIDAGGAYLGSQTASSEGYAIFHIFANTSASGAIPVNAGGLSTTITLSGTSPLRLKEGTATIYLASPIFTYLPVISH